MPSFYGDNDDLQFYFDRYLDWRPLVDLIEDYQHPEAPDTWEQAVETYREIAEMMGRFAAEEVAPRAAAIDRAGAHLVDGEVKVCPEHEELFTQLRDLGVYGLCTPRELGGLNCPGLLYLFVCEMMARADVSVMTHFGFHVAPAVTLLSYAVREGSVEFDERGRVKKTRWESIIREFISGAAWGAMDLTEPNAGSDLACLRTRAVQDEQGVWRITGNKIFITSGHGKYHLVLAKTDDRDSLAALSLFLVPLTLERDGATVRNAWVDRVEEKTGHHGSPTCSVIFDNSEGELIGEVGQGFALMLHLMNHARLGVGFESIGVCEAAYRAARSYAAERVTMGQPIARHPMIADALDEMDVTIRGLRALAVEGAMAEEMASYLELQEKRFTNVALDPQRQRQLRRLRRKARHITPLLKYLASEEAVRFARMGMQIHGGNGYTTDYPAERYLRDALVLPVYEGTSQIQALMALKDNLGAAIKNPQRFVRKAAAAKLNAMRATDPLERAYHRVVSMSYLAQQHLLWQVAKNKAATAIGGRGFSGAIEKLLHGWDPKRDFQHGLLHAERLTRLLADVAIARALLDQAERFPERRVHAERWLERAEPRARYNLDLIQSTGDRLIASLGEGAENPADDRAAG